MGLYLLKPSLFPFITINADIIAFTFIAWLLLAIDTTLKLGVIDELISIAKGLKDLS
jgi:hypothetical protein